MTVFWVILRGQQMYTVIQAVHSILYNVAKCHFFSVVTWKDKIKYVNKIERCTHFCEILYNQIKSLLLSHHHSTSALVSEILMSVLQTVQKNNRQFTYGQTVQKKQQTIYIWTDSAKKTTDNLHMDRQWLHNSGFGRHTEPFTWDSRSLLMGINPLALKGEKCCIHALWKSVWGQSQPEGENRVLVCCALKGKPHKASVMRCYLNVKVRVF